MPRTPITVNALSAASAPGTVLTDPTPTAADTANGNSVANTGMTYLRVKNNDTAQHTITLLTPGTVDGSLTIADDPRVIPASSVGFIARLPVSVYGSTLQFTSDSAQLGITAFEP
jgi:3D (Asp-Asp-Asp) domain-containing protein